MKNRKLRRGNQKRKTESLLITAKKKKMTWGPIISKWKLKRRYSVNRKCSFMWRLRWKKLAKKEYKFRQEWVGKVIHWELCKVLEFDHTTKWYMYTLESTVENETYKILCDFEIKTNLSILARRRDLELMNKKKKKKKKTCPQVDFIVLTNRRLKMKRKTKKKQKTLQLLLLLLLQLLH